MAVPVAEVGSASSTAKSHLVNGAASTPVTSTGAKIELDSIESAVEAVARGECVVVVDDLGRENEGDLIVAASKCSTEMMAFIIRHSSGFVCIAVTGERLDALNLPLMVVPSTDPRKTAYTHTVDYKHGTTTGISAHDRALTARAVADTTMQAADFSRPGHLCPLRAVPGGVLERRGHTEAAIDLCRLAGLPPAGAICELVKPDDPQGSMARRDDCYAFARQYGLKMISIEDLANYRLRLQNGSGAATAPPGSTDPTATGADHAGAVA